MTQQSLSRRGLCYQRAVAMLMVIVIFLQSGCATTVPAPAQTRHQASVNPDKMVVVAGAGNPEIRLEGFVHGKVEGAAAAGGSTFVACASGLARGGGCSGAFCGAVVILWLGVCGVAGTVGGVVGAVTTPKASKIRTAEATLQSALDARTIQESLREQVVVAGSAAGVRLSTLTLEGAAAAAPRDYRPLRDAGVEHVLEVALAKVGTDGSGTNSPIALVMQAQVRMVRTADNTEVFSSTYDYSGKRLKLAEWSADQGKRLLDALQVGYEALGRQIYENVFLLYPFPDWNAHSGGMLVATFGLGPVYPLTRGQLSGDPFFSEYFEWKEVDSLRPTLAWQAFPRDSDRKASPSEMTRVTNVRYDLVIARERNQAADEVVYRREGLPEPRHALEILLRPDTHYLWSVRARFSLDGRERVTEWGSINYAARERVTAPSRWSYRFKTPL